jgi:Protein kinase domain
MGKCSATDCNQSLSIFNSRSCLVCRKKFCRRCILEDDKSSNFFSVKGFCYKCFVNLKINEEEVSHTKNFARELEEVQGVRTCDQSDENDHKSAQVIDGSGLKENFSAPVILNRPVAAIVISRPDKKPCIVLDEPSLNVIKHPSYPGDIPVDEGPVEDSLNSNKNAASIMKLEPINQSIQNILESISSPVENTKPEIPSNIELNPPHVHQNLSEYREVIEKDPFTQFIKISIIGRGTFSKVYKVQDSGTLNFYALKHLESAQQAFDQVMAEFLQSLLSKCPNIVPSYALYKFQTDYYILQELMATSLGDFIKHNPNIPEIVALYILKEITKGLNFIHSNNQVHRDIKSDNIFIDFYGNVKIGDFGNCVQLTDENSFRTTLAGSPLWLSPEVVTGKVYDTKSDIWSLGIIGIELIEGQPPHSKSKNLQQLFNLISTGPAPQLSPQKAPTLSQVTRLCLEKAPSLRRTAKELLQTQFFNACYDSSKDYIISRLNGI